VRVCVVAIAVAGLAIVGSTNARASDCTLRRTDGRLGQIISVPALQLIRAQLQADHASTPRGRIGRLLAIQAAGMKIIVARKLFTHSADFWDRFNEFLQTWRTSLPYLGPFRSRC
jgi:hypothetical protein